MQAHYRSELEFSWDNLGAALTRLKRMVMAVSQLRAATEAATEITHPKLTELLARFDAAISDDLNTPIALTLLEEAITLKKINAAQKLATITRMDEVTGLALLTLSRTDLRLRPKAAHVTDAEIDAAIVARKQARDAKDYAASDQIRDDMAAKGVALMDGDSMGWEWLLPS